METYKGLLIPELFIEEEYSTYDWLSSELYHCSNSLCRPEIVCSKCLFNLKHNKLFNEWIIIKNREKKLKRILNGI